MTAILHVYSGTIVICAIVPFFEGPGALIGYVGPGAGLSMVGALLAVVCVIVLALLGPILYPFFAVRSWLRMRHARKALRTTRCEDYCGDVSGERDESEEAEASYDPLTRSPVAVGSTCPPESPSTSL